MPVLQIEKINNVCRWGLWEITESLDELSSMVDFSLEDPTEYSQIHNETKKLEWLAGKLMLKTLVESVKVPYRGIHKDVNGKPFLHHYPYQISITHSQKYVAAILNTKSAVGIDIEKIKQKVLNVRGKFLSVQEIATADENLEMLTKFWCGKEALYKLKGKKGVIFSKDLGMDLHEKDEACLGFIYYNGVVSTQEVKFRKIEDYILAFAL